MENKISRKKITIGIFVIFLCCSALFAFYNQSSFFQDNPIDSKNEEVSSHKNSFDVHGNLMLKNESYVEGVALMSSRNYIQARERFNRALNNTDDIQESGQVQYQIAMTHAFLNEPIDAIRIYKEIVKKEDYIPTLRAFAVQQIGGMYYRYNSEEVFEEIFKDEPFVNLKVENNVVLSLRNLYEFGSSFDRLGVIEIRIARFYSSEALKIYLSGANTLDSRQVIEESKLIARQRIANADAFMASLPEGDPAQIYKEEIILRKASVLGDLKIMDDSVPDPEKYFKEALDIFQSSGNVGDEAVAKYSYALFLAKINGVENQDKIRELLADFYNSSKYDNFSLVRSIKNEATNPNGVLKDDLRILAQFDPLFREYLVGLGLVL